MFCEICDDDKYNFDAKLDAYALCNILIYLFDTIEN